MWGQLLQHRFLHDADEPDDLSGVASLQLSHRSLYRNLHGTLEVKGWATNEEAEAGDQNAWWRCTVVALRVASAKRPPDAQQQKEEDEDDEDEDDDVDPAFLDAQPRVVRLEGKGEAWRDRVDALAKALAG